MNRRASSSFRTPRSAVVYRLWTSGPPRRGASDVITDFRPVLVGFPEPDRVLAPLRELGSDPLPEGQGEVLGGRDQPTEPGHVGVEVAVVHVLDHAPLDHLRELL